jgi:hypothetical protein
VSRGASRLFQERSTTAIRAKLATGSCTVLAGHGGVIYLFAHGVVVWGTDQTAAAELARDCGAIRCQRGPWVKLTAAQQRMARMAAAVGKSAAASAAAAEKASAQVATALVGAIVEMADLATYGCPAPLPKQWLVTHTEEGGLAVAEPVGLTDAQRGSSDLLARRIKPDGSGYRVYDRTYCDLFVRSQRKGSLAR